MKRYRTKKTEAAPEGGRQAARDYIARGWKPLPVSRGNKGPTSKGWPEWQVGDNPDTYIKEHFGGLPFANVAVQLGAMSGGLTDVDLDCAEAVRLAPEFLPRRERCSGREFKVLRPHPLLHHRSP